MQYSLTFPSGTVRSIFQSRFEELSRFTDTENCIFLVDSKVAGLHTKLISNHRAITITAEETQKSLSQLEEVVAQLLKLEAHRQTTLIGVGGGITTDLTGFIASTYMRGIPFGFVPTTLLGMADAAIGGKNGLNLGLQKNLLGTIQQPTFIFYDTRFLATLPPGEWSNGFAEIIKYACLFDNALFEELSLHDLAYYQNNSEGLQLLIERCVDWKNNIVLSDEKENNKRKLLNFGHTVGHAIETVHSLPHGAAVALGIAIACRISETHSGLAPAITERLQSLLNRYNLPSSYQLRIDDLMQVLKMDKKRTATSIDYILLEDIAKPLIKDLPFSAIQEALENHCYAGSN